MAVTVTLHDGDTGKYMRFGDTFIKHNDGALDVIRAGAKSPTATPQVRSAAQELVQFLRFDAGENGRVTDLVAVQMQDRPNGPVVDRVEEFGGLPSGGQRPCLGLAVADDARDN